LDAVLAHQPLDPVTADVLAGAQQRLPGPPVAVGAVVRLMDLTDPAEQPLVLQRPV
jgi:hypothetical protein